MEDCSLETKLAALVYSIKDDLPKLWKLRSRFVSALVCTIIERLSCKGTVNYNKKGLRFEIIQQGREKWKGEKEDKPLKIVVYQHGGIYPFIQDPRVWPSRLSHDQILSAVEGPGLVYPTEDHVPRFHIDHNIPSSPQIVSLAASIKHDPTSIILEHTSLVQRVIMFRFVDQVYMDAAKVLLDREGFFFTKDSDEGFYSNKAKEEVSIDTKVRHYTIEGKKGYMVKLLTGEE